MVISSCFLAKCCCLLGLARKCLDLIVLFQSVELSFVGSSRSLNSRMEELKLQDREDRKHLVLWKQPFTTLKYFSFEFIIKVQKSILRYQVLCRLCT